MGWLYLEPGDQVRRLRLYPKHWNRRSDPELEWPCRRAPREPGPVRRLD